MCERGQTGGFLSWLFLFNSFSMHRIINFPWKKKHFYIPVPTYHKILSDPSKIVSSFEIKVDDPHDKEECSFWEQTLVLIRPIRHSYLFRQYLMPRFTLGCISKNLMRSNKHWNKIFLLDQKIQALECQKINKKQFWEKLC